MKILAPMLLFVAFLIIGCDSKESDDASPLTREQGEQILEELRAMNAKLEDLAKAQAKRPASAKSNKVSMQLQEGQRLGDPKAPVVLVEFFDFQCPYCKRFADQTFPQLKREYIDTGKLLYVALDLPLKFHKQARVAAMASHCAADQGKYWEYRDHLVNNMKKLSKTDLLKYAGELGLESKSFSSCLEEERYAKRVDDSLQLAKSIGVTGTPSFVMGPNNGARLNGTKLVGAKPYKTFKARLDGIAAGK